MPVDNAGGSCQIASQAGYFTLKLTCSAELSFEDVFRNFLRRIPGTFYRSEVDNPFAARRTVSGRSSVSVRTSMLSPPTPL